MVSPDRRSIPAEVLAVLSRTMVRVIVAPGDGGVDGGVHCDLDLKLVPEVARFPGAKLWLDVDRHGKVYAARSRVETDDGES
jgi:hypothetical protein